MILLRQFVLCLLLVASAVGAAGNAPEPGKALDAASDWISYRDAYRSMLWFEKYGEAKNLLQIHFQIQPKNRSATVATPLQVTLVGKSQRLNLPPDDTGRLVLPLLKAAYDDNAELQINQKVADLTFQAVVSLALRADGIYEAADLRAACQQALAYQNWRDASLLRGKKCVGVRFVFGKKTATGALEFRKPDQSLHSLPLQDGPAALRGNEPGSDNFRVANWLFAAWPDKGQVLTRSAPLAIVAVFE